MRQTCCHRMGAMKGPVFNGRMMRNADDFWQWKSHSPCRRSGDAPRVSLFKRLTGAIYGLHLHRADRSALSPQSSRGMLLILAAWAVHLSPLWSRISSSFPFFSSPQNQVAFCSPAAVLITRFSTAVLPPLLLHLLLPGNERIFFLEGGGGRSCQSCTDPEGVWFISCLSVSENKGVLCKIPSLSLRLFSGG